MAGGESRQGHNLPPRRFHPRLSGDVGRRLGVGGRGRRTGSLRAGQDEVTSLGFRRREVALWRSLGGKGHTRKEDPKRESVSYPFEVGEDEDFGEDLGRRRRETGTGTV